MIIFIQFNSQNVTWGMSKMSKFAHGKIKKSDI